MEWKKEDPAPFTVLVTKNFIRFNKILSVHGNPLPKIQIKQQSTNLNKVRNSTYFMVSNP